MKLSVAIPCFNEKGNIPLLLERFTETIGGRDMEVILVDNGSTDGSAEMIQQLIPKYTFARTIRVAVNQGYGYGILQGLKATTGDFIGWTHADMQTDPADVVKAYDLIEKNNGDDKLFFKGLRQGRPLFDRFFTNGMSLFETLYMGVLLHDINAQPNFFSAKFFKTWKNPPYDFSLDLYALYMAKKVGLRVKRFDVKFPERVYGASHWNTDLASKWQFIKRTIEFSVSLKCRLAE